MTHCIGCLVMVAALAACGSKDGKGSRPAPSEDKKVAARAGATSDLWALAPVDAAAGFVIAEGTIDAAYATLEEYQRVVNARPSTARLYKELLAAIPKEEFDPLDRAAAVEWGIDLAGGLAIFFDQDMEVISGVLPIRSLDDLARHSEEKIETVDGRKVLPQSDGDVCTEAAGRVMCGRDLAAIDASIKGGSDISKRLAAYPADKRGDIELVLDSQRVAGMKRGLDEAGPMVRNPGLVVVTARYDDGLIEVNASFQGKLPMLKLKPPSTMPTSFQGLDRGAVGLVRWHMDPQTVFSQAPPFPPSIPVGEGVDLRTDLIDQLSGDFVMVTRGDGIGDGMFGIGLKDAGPVKKALPTVCRLAVAQMPEAKIEVTDTGCRGTVPIPPDPSLPPGLFPKQLTGTLTVRDGVLWLEVGDVSIADGAPAASPHTAALLGDQHLVVWARSLDPLATVSDDMQEVVDGLLAKLTNAEQRSVIDAVRWGLAHIAEVGFAVSEKDGWYHGTLVVATYAADPDDVYHGYEAAVQKGLDGDRAGYRAAMKALASNANTLAGRQAKIVEAGAPPVGAGSGILAAIAIPAFMKYIRKSKTTEARQFVRKMHDGARAHYAETGKLPAAVGPTPPLGSCCKGSGDKCFPNAKLWDHPTWIALQFSVDDPHFYSYAFITDGDSFTVQAMGDLDCDGIYSTFEMYHSPGNEGSNAVYRQNELE